MSNLEAHKNTVKDYRQEGSQEALINHVEENKELNFKEQEQMIGYMIGNASQWYLRKKKVHFVFLVAFIK